MALKLDPVRLLIADDVGIGKTIEAGADRPRAARPGERRAARRALPAAPRRAVAARAARRSSTSTPNWCSPCTVTRLERGLARRRVALRALPDTSIVSTDFIKSDRRRDDFIRACPELVIVDEAHTCRRPARRHAAATSATSCCEALAADPDRHLMLVTATPHCGNEDAFRSLSRCLDVTRDLARRPDRSDARGRRRGWPTTSCSAAAPTSAHYLDDRHAVPRPR